MKKINIIFLLLVAVFLLTSCTKNNVSLLEKLTEYQEKIESMLENEDEISHLLSLSSTNLDDQLETDPFFLPRDKYLETYNKQRDNSTDVSIDFILMQYKILLDEVIKKLDENEIDIIVAEIEIDYRGIIDLNVYLELLRSGEILIRLSLDVYDYKYYSGLKMGYIDEDFYLIELTKNIHDESFEYIDFLENNHVINIRYRLDHYWYRYQNQNDNTYYEISETTEFNETSFGLKWFNPETMVRTNMNRGGEGDFNFFELFNDKSIYFEYLEYIDSDEILVAWQLLEATGWDYIYHEENSNNPLNGIYKNSEKIFSDARVNLGLDENFANVRVEYKMNKEALTDDHLNLSYYGLTFNYQDLTIEKINQLIANTMIESSTMSIYKGIDFLNDDLSQALYDAIDDDVKPVK
jgi:hypothetical protein